MSDNDTATEPDTEHGSAAPVIPAVDPEIAALTPYVPGKPIEELKRELSLPRAIKLASNENPLGASPLAQEAIRDATDAVHFYPDGGAFYLKQGLSSHLDVEPAEILVANGSNEAIELIVRTFGSDGARAVVSAHSFVIYKLASLAARVAVDEVPMKDDLHFDLEAMAAAVTPSTRFVFLANPNNPTGTYFGQEALESFLDAVPDDVIVVLDEAYFEFVDAADYPDGIALRGHHPNLVILRTFSKCYGLAGLRLGYGVLPAALNDYIERVRAPFNTNLIAQRACLAALGDTEFVKQSVAHTIRAREQLAEGVRSLGLRAVPSVTNFVLVELPIPASTVFEALLHKGVIVRPMAGYGLPNHVRISVGLEEEIDECIEALGAVLAEHDQ